MDNLCFNSKIVPKYFLHFTVAFYFQTILSPVPQNQNNRNIYIKFLEQQQKKKQEQKKQQQTQKQPKDYVQRLKAIQWQGQYRWSH